MTHLAAEIVQTMAKEFDIASLEQEEKMELEGGLPACLVRIIPVTIK